MGIDEDGLREAYVAALGESKYDTIELDAVHTLAERAQQTLDPRYIGMAAGIGVFIGGTRKN